MSSEIKEQLQWIGEEVSAQAGLWMMKKGAALLGFKFFLTKTRPGGQIEAVYTGNDKQTVLRGLVEYVANEYPRN